MKEIASFIVTLIQYMIGLSALILHYEYSQEHPDVFIDMEKTFLFLLMGLIVLPAFLSINKFWDEVFGVK
jgi:hypothetical protein